MTLLIQHVEEPLKQAGLDLYCFQKMINQFENS